MGNVAEREILKFKRDDPADKAAACMIFMKQICGFEFYPTQLMDADESFRHNYVLNCKPPRGGKSSVMEAIDMYEMFTNPYEDLRIYAPKYDQARDTLAYHYNWIDRSPLLKAYVRKKGGKLQLTNSSYELLNGSNSKIYSIRGEIEGHNVTIMRPEEFDLWPWEVFQNDVMRRGLAKNANGLPTRIRISGTIMGKENIHKLATDPNFSKRYRNLMYAHEENILNMEPGTMIDIYTLIAMGVIDEDFVEQWKDQVDPDEWARSALLKFTESTNFIWSSYLLAILRKANEWGLEGVEHKPGGIYDTDGVVAFGLDCGHAGSKKESSKYSLQIIEKRGRYRRWLFSKEWKPDTDTQLLEKEIMEVLAYFRPAGGYGDALNHTLINSINQRAFSDGITSINHDKFPGNSPGTWAKWWFTPLWNTGKAKHFFFDSLQKHIHGAKFYFPYYDKKDGSKLARSCNGTIASIMNIRKEENESNYPSYRPFNAKISDDPADALGMANFWLDNNTDEPLNFNLLKGAGQGRVTEGLQASVLNSFSIDRNDYDSF